MFLVLPGIIQLAIYPITRHETNPVVVYSKRCTDCCWMTISCINILPIMPHNAPAVFAFRVIIPNRKSPPSIIRKTKNSSFKNEKSKKEVDVTITVSNKDIV